MAATETNWSLGRARRDWESHSISPGRSACRWRRVGSPTLTHDASQVECLGLKIMGCLVMNRCDYRLSGASRMFPKKVQQVKIGFIQVLEGGNLGWVSSTGHYLHRSHGCPCPSSCLKAWPELKSTRHYLTTKLFRFLTQIFFEQDVQDTR